jgi:hypothetical protein
MLTDPTAARRRSAAGRIAESWQALSSWRFPQVSEVHMRVRVLRAEARAARVPAEVMQLVIVAWKIHLADDLTIRGGTRLDIDKAHSVAFPIPADVTAKDLPRPIFHASVTQSRGRQ